MTIRSALRASEIRSLAASPSRCTHDYVTGWRRRYRLRKIVAEPVIADIKQAPLRSANYYYGTLSRRGADVA